MHKVKFAKKEDAPEPLREFLKDTEDKSGFEVSLVPAIKLDEFRNNNIRVSQELESLKPAKTALDGILGKDKDGKANSLEQFVAELTGLRETAQKVADGKIKTTDAIEAELATRTGTMKQTYEQKLDASARELFDYKTKLTNADQKIRQMVVDGAINAVCMDDKVGINPHAMPDVLRRAREVFTVQEDGTLVPKENGVVLRGEDGTTAMNPAEWMKSLRKTASHYFKGSSGGGAGEGGGNTDARYGGMTQDAFNKLPAKDRLAIANRLAMSAA